MREPLRLGALVVLVACGSKQPPPSPVAHAPPRPSTADCRDVGVLLRGELESDDPQEGPAKERAVEAACRDDRWPQAVIDCVASAPPAHAEACLDQLDAKQRAAWAARIDRFEQARNDQLVDKLVIIDKPVADEVPCPLAAADPTVFPPALDEQAKEREWTENLRRHWLFEECEHGWSSALKLCLRGAVGNAGKTDACLASALAPDERDELTRTMADFDRLAAKVAAAKERPATIGCKQVVAYHYGDARWKTKLDGYAPAERKKMIAASRATMMKACTDHGWADTLRACIVVGGEDACFRTYGMSLRWGYPAAGVVGKLGVKECDEYGAAVTKLAKCDKISLESRDALLHSFHETQAHVAAQPAADRAKMASSCSVGLAAIAEVAKSAGC